jgi:hypothetical protein
VGGVWVVGGWLESKLSEQLWLSFSLALAKPTKWTAAANSISSSSSKKLN